MGSSFSPRMAGLALASLFLCSTAQAEPDTAFLREYSQTRGFLAGRPQKTRFSHDDKAVLFLRSEAHNKLQRLFQTDLASGLTSELASPASLLGGRAEQVSVEEMARRERMRLQTSGFADYYQNPKDERILLPLSGQLYLFDRVTRKVEQLGIQGPVIDPQWSPDGSKIAYVRNYDVYVWDLTQGRETAVTRGGNIEVTHGVAEFVAQEEMRRLTGFWWSPDSRKIAYEEADHRGVEVWNISDPSKPDQPPQRQYYPRPGKKNVSARLGIVSIYGKGPTVWVKRPVWAEYLGAVTWSKLGPLTLQWQDRSQKRLDLVRVDPVTGASTNLLTERDPGWVNLHQGLPVWLPGNRQFFFIRIQDGQERLCVVDAADGKTTTLLPQPGQAYELSEFARYDAKTKRVDVRIDKTPGDPQVVSMTLGGEPAVESGQGVSDLTVSHDGNLRLVTEHTVAHLPQTRVLDRQGKEIARLPSVAVEPALELNYTFTPLKAADGKLLYNAAVIKPRAFDPSKKYPVILDVYGGPHHLHVTQSRRPWLIDQWLADQGFLVVAVDNRGTPGRGVEWETSVLGKFGALPLDDQIKGVTELSHRVPQMDLSRVGIAGWSFGGYMSALAVLKRPDFFKAAVAGAPVTDWEDYDTHYTERYMGLLPQSREAYDASSLLPMAKELKSHLLLVHGTADDNVYLRNSLRLADALFRAGQPFEYLPLAGMTHSYSADATVTERLWLRSAAFFRQHLGEPRP